MYRNEELYKSAELYQVLVDMLANKINTEHINFIDFLNSFSESEFLREVLTTTDTIFLELQSVTNNKISVFKFREIMQGWGTLASYEKLIKLVLSDVVDIVATSNKDNLFNGIITTKIVVKDNTYLLDNKNNYLLDNKNNYLIILKILNTNIVKFKEFLIKYTPNPYKIQFEFLIDTSKIRK